MSTLEMCEKFAHALSWSRSEVLYPFDRKVWREIAVIWASALRFKFQDRETGKFIRELLEVPF